MLINDMARNYPSEKSDTTASARVLAGQRILGSNLGTVLDNRMAVNRQEANNGSLSVIDVRTRLRRFSWISIVLHQ